MERRFRLARAGLVRWHLSWIPSSSCGAGRREGDDDERHLPRPSRAPMPPQPPKPSRTERLRSLLASRHLRHPRHRGRAAALPDAHRPCRRDPRRRPLVGRALGREELPVRGAGRGGPRREQVHGLHPRRLAGQPLPAARVLRPHPRPRLGPAALGPGGHVHGSDPRRIRGRARPPGALGARPRAAPRTVGRPARGPGEGGRRPGPRVRVPVPRSRVRRALAPREQAGGARDPGHEAGRRAPRGGRNRPQGRPRRAT